MAIKKAASDAVLANGGTITLAGETVSGTLTGNSSFNDVIIAAGDGEFYKKSQATAGTIAAGDRTTPDLGGNGNTDAFADAIISRC